jgi:sporulation protein YlmC with PRC-barrel domain
MKIVSILLMSSALALLPVPYAGAQTAGSTRLGVAVAELNVVAVGWSVKKQILGKTVYNESNQKVGRIDDLIVAPDSAVSFAIIGAGGFVGLGRHDVAIPVQQIKLQDDKFMLPGATKEAIKALPKFEYAKKQP